MYFSLEVAAFVHRPEIQSPEVFDEFPAPARPARAGRFGPRDASLSTRPRTLAPAPARGRGPCRAGCRGARRRRSGDLGAVDEPAPRGGLDRPVGPHRHRQRGDDPDGRLRRLDRPALLARGARRRGAAAGLHGLDGGDDCLRSPAGRGGQRRAARHRLGRDGRHPASPAAVLSRPAARTPGGTEEGAERHRRERRAADRGRASCSRASAPPTSPRSTPRRGRARGPVPCGWPRCSSRSRRSSSPRWCRRMAG